MLVKGAPEGLLSLCTDQLGAGGTASAVDAAALQDLRSQLHAWRTSWKALVLLQGLQTLELVPAPGHIAVAPEHNVA